MGRCRPASVAGGPRAVPFCAAVVLLSASSVWAQSTPSVRAVRIKAVADESFRENKKWEREIQEHFGWADKEMRKIAGVGFDLVATEPWTTHESEALTLLLSELRAGVDKGEAEVVVGFTGHDPPESAFIYQGEVYRYPLPFIAGIAFPLGDRAVVRRGDSKKDTRHTLMHEIAHLFGGLHVEEKSILESYTERTNFALDSYNKRIFELTIDREFDRNVRDLSRDELIELVELYREAPLIEDYEPDTAIRIAYLYLAYGDVDQALAEFKKALAVAPGSSREVLHYAIIPELEDFMARNEPTVETRFVLGQAYSISGDLEESVEQLEPNCTGSVEHAPSCSLLGNVTFKQASSRGRLEQKDFQEAERLLLRALELDDLLADAYSGLASLYASVGLIDRALPNFDRAQELDSDNPEIHFNKGLAYLFVDKPGPAEASLRQVLELREGVLRDSTKLALALARQGKSKEARRWLKEAEKQSFLSAYVLRDMAEVYFLSGDSKKASKHLQLAKKGGVDTQAVEALIDQGDRKPRKVSVEDMIEQAAAYVRTERYETARKLLAQAAEKKPNEAKIYYWLGEINAWEENREEAARQYRRSLEFDPDYAPSYLELGVVAWHDSDCEQAVDWLTQYQERSDRPGSYSYYVMGVCLYDLGRLEEAEENLLGAIQRSAEYGSAFYYLALTYLKAEEPDAAIRELRLAIESRRLPRWQEREANWRLAQLLSDGGDATDARQHARVAARLGKKEAARLLEELESTSPNSR